MTTTFTEQQIAHGEAFYMALYGHEGAIWSANEHKDLWHKAAARYDAALLAASECAPSGEPSEEARVCHSPTGYGLSVIVQKAEVRDPLENCPDIFRPSAPTPPAQEEGKP